MALGSRQRVPPMTWAIDLTKLTAHCDGVIVRFAAVPADAATGSDCFQDSEGAHWRGKFAPNSVLSSDDAQRMRTLYESVDAYRNAARKAIDPFPAE